MQLTSSFQGTVMVENKLAFKMSRQLKEVDQDLQKFQEHPHYGRRLLGKQSPGAFEPCFKG